MKQIALLLTAALLVLLLGCSQRATKDTQLQDPTASDSEMPVDHDAVDSTHPESTDPEATEQEPQKPERIITQVDERYFSDALFIGDSRTDGLRLYAPISGADYYCGTSMTVFGIMDSQESVGGVTGLRNLLNTKTYGKIYLMLGINEAGYDTDRFAESYQSVVEEIRASQPDAIIYVQSILYVTQKHEQKNPVFSTENLKQKNARIAALADGENTVYLEVNDALNDGTDHLPEDYTGDGVHLKPSYYGLWRDYLMANAVVDGAHPWEPKVQTDDGARIKGVMDGILEGVSSEWQAVVGDPSTGEQIAVAQSVGSTGDYMKSVSFIRLFIMGDVYSMIKDGTLREEDVLADLAAMITENDAAAADRLVDLLGGGSPEKGREHVKSFAGSLGFKVGFNRGLAEQSTAYNYVSADMVAELLTRIARDECMGPEYDGKMRELLFAVKAEDYELGYQENVRKGFLFDEASTGVLGTAGIVNAGGRTYVVCILANDVRHSDSARELMKELHTAIYPCFVR